MHRRDQVKILEIQVTHRNDASGLDVDWIGNADADAYDTGTIQSGTVEKLRKEFPVGCRIVLDEMDDRQAPTIGTQGTCNGVDDAGNILVSWDTGSHLNVAYGADSCHRVATDAEVKVSLDRLGKTRQTGPRCPRCGAKPDCYDHQQQALSRRAAIQICNRCGTEEALEDIAWGG